MRFASAVSVSRAYLREMNGENGHRALGLSLEYEDGAGEWKPVCATDEKDVGEWTVALCTGGGDGSPVEATPPTPSPPSPNTPPVQVAGGSWHWGMSMSTTQSDAGFSWYTNTFALWQEGHPLWMQMGMGGTWLTPANVNFGDTCACNPDGWPSAYPIGDPSNGCCDAGRGSCAHLYQTFEGGPGYWIGQLPTVVPKWRVNSAVGC